MGAKWKIGWDIWCLGGQEECELACTVVRRSSKYCRCFVDRVRQKWIKSVQGILRRMRAQGAHNQRKGVGQADEGDESVE